MAFFGFTWCPDVCPTTLIDISDWLDELGPDADRLNVVLITVDPERDTPAGSCRLPVNFDPRIVGLTGSLSEIERAAAGFRALFEKVPRDGDYTMNHTAGVFLYHADGRFAGIIDFHEDRRFAVPKIRRTDGDDARLRIDRRAAGHQVRRETEDGEPRPPASDVGRH